jgi:hypothetical protein
MMWSDVGAGACVCCCEFRAAPSQEENTLDERHGWILIWFTQMVHAVGFHRSLQKQPLWFECG